MFVCVSCALSFFYHKIKKKKKTLITTATPIKSTKTIINDSNSYINCNANNHLTDINQTTSSDDLLTILTTPIQDVTAIIRTKTADASASAAAAATITTTATTLLENNNKRNIKDKIFIARNNDFMDKDDKEMNKV